MNGGRMSCPMPIISGLGRRRQESHDGDFEISLGYIESSRETWTTASLPQTKYLQQLTIRDILLCVIYVDNQRTEATTLCGNLNVKLWAMKRLGNVENDLEFWGTNKRKIMKYICLQVWCVFFPLTFVLNM